MDEAQRIELLAKALEPDVDAATRARIAQARASDPDFARELDELLEAQAAVAESAAAFVSHPELALGAEAVAELRRTALLRGWLADDAKLNALVAAVDRPPMAASEGPAAESDAAWNMAVAELREAREACEALSRTYVANAEFVLTAEQRQRVRQAARVDGPAVLSWSLGGLWRVLIGVAGCAAVVVALMVSLRQPLSRSLRSGPQPAGGYSPAVFETKTAPIGAPASSADWNNAKIAAAPSAAPVAASAPPIAESSPPATRVIVDERAELSRLLTELPVGSATPITSSIVGPVRDPADAVRQAVTRAASAPVIAIETPSDTTMFVHAAAELRPGHRYFVQRWDYEFERQANGWHLRSVRISYLVDRGSASFEAK